MSSEDDVRAASETFYAALNRMANGDNSTMADAWWHEATVTAMHPIGERTVGWDAVEGSFAQVASMSSDGAIALQDQTIHVVGDMAYELGVESGSFKLGGHAAKIDQRVTNVYRRQDGAWRLVHHHADISPSMIQVLSLLEAPAR